MQNLIEEDDIEDMVIDEQMFLGEAADTSSATASSSSSGLGSPVVAISSGPASESVTPSSVTDVH